MMYTVRTMLIDKPSNEAARILWSLGYNASFEVFSSKEAVLHFVKRVEELKRVCNRNNRGEKIEFEWKEASMHMYISCGKELVADVWFSPVTYLTDELEVERMIDCKVHRDSMTIFDQYLAEKEKGGREE